MTPFSSVCVEKDQQSRDNRKKKKRKADSVLRSLTPTDDWSSLTPFSFFNYPKPLLLLLLPLSQKRVNKTQKPYYHHTLPFLGSVDLTLLHHITVPLQPSIALSNNSLLFYYFFISILFLLLLIFLLFMFSRCCFHWNSTLEFLGF